MNSRHLLVAAVVVAAPFLHVPTAVAHTGNLSGSTVCADSGWSVTWTARNTEAGQAMTPDTPGFAPSPIPANGNGTLVQSFPASQPSATIAGYFRFADGFTDPYSLTIAAPTGCTPATTTTTVPATTTTVPATSTTVAPTPTTAPSDSSARVIPPVTVTGDNVEAPVLPVTGSHTLELTALGAGLAGAGNWMRRWSNRKAAE